MIIIAGVVLIGMAEERFGFLMEAIGPKCDVNALDARRADKSRRKQ